MGGGAGSGAAGDERAPNGRCAATLGALRAVMRVLVSEPDPDRLAQRVCESITRTRGYHDAWIGRLDGDGRVRFAAHAGAGQTLPGLAARVAAGDLPDCLRAALRSADPVLRATPGPDCDCPWVDDHREFAAMATRLQHHGQRLGIMYVTLPVGAVADPLELETFRDVADAVTLALASLETAAGHRRALQQLDLLSRAIEQVPVMVVVVDREARIEYVNPQFCAVTGYSADEALGMKGTDLGVPAGAEAARMWEQLRAGGSWRGEMLKRRKDGSTYWEEAIISAILAPDGRVIHHVKVAADVTERRAALDALRASEEKYRTIIEAASDAILIADAETGILLEVNSKAAALLGRPASELVGMHQRDLHPPGDAERYQSIFREHAGRATPGLARDDVVVLRADGTRVPIEITGSVIEIDGRKLVHGNFRDVTARRHLEQQLRQAEKMQAIGQLAGGIAHDFNNRLVAILGFAELLARQLPEGPHRKYADRIVRNSRRAANLTGQLLAFARKANYQAVPIDLHAAIREVVLFLMHGIDRNIVVRMHLAARPAVTRGDPAQLENALLNLTLNARDAMPDGGALTVRTASVALDDAECRRLGLEPKASGFVTIAVTDTGTGMDEHVRAHLFEPFFTTKKMGEGSGMGLAAVYGTIHSHGGAIEVDTEVGRGTTFTLYLPVEEAEPVEERLESVPPRARDARILIVDDEADVRELVRDMLGSLGYQVVTCRDGVEAAALYAREWSTLDLVVLDMIMPRQGGRATLEQMRRINPGVKALLATGVGLDGQAAEILEGGAVAFVQKPFALHELAEKVAQALEP